MQHRLVKLLCLVLMLGTIGCKDSFICQDDQLSIAKRAYQGSQILTDGYFYGETSDNKYADLFWLYRNGVLLSPGATEMDRAISGNLNEYPDSFLKNNKWPWGLYNIDGNIISIERWYPGRCGVETIYEEAEILNNESFRLYLREYKKDGKVVKSEDIDYIFKLFHQNNKPDSLNSFLYK